jgi:hypothetical protein
MKNRSRLGCPVVLSCFFMLAAIVPAFPADLLSELPFPRSTALFPTVQEARGEAVLIDGKAVSPFYCILEKDPKSGALALKSASALSFVKIEMNRSLRTTRIVTMISLAFRDVIDKLGYETKDITLDATDTVGFLTYRISNKTKTTREYARDDNTLESEVVPVYFQGLLLNGIKRDFLFDVITDEIGWKARILVTYKETKDLKALSPGFIFPAGFGALESPKNPYSVFVLSIDGFLSLFVHAKTFLAFESVPPYSFVAYWGGEGIRRQIIYITEKIR